MRRDLWNFGQDIGRPDLAEIVEHLYDAALQTSSKKTYGTGQRAYFRFAQEIGREEAYAPFAPSHLNNTELYISFFLAYLVLKPSVTKATTILGYEGHIKYLFREQGCSPDEYKTPFLGQLRKGIKNVYPQQADKREAFFVPLYFKTRQFKYPETKTKYLARLATVLGFFGMLRPHMFSTLGPCSFVFVLKKGQRMGPYKTTDAFQHGVKALPDDDNVLGFYFSFKSKTMTHARAYFPNLGSSSLSYRPICPLRLLWEVSKKG